MGIKKLMILFCFIAMAGATASANMIYELVVGANPVAELELAQLPAGPTDIVELRILPSLSSVFPDVSLTGNINGEWSFLQGDLILSDSLGGLKADGLGLSARALSVLPPGRTIKVAQLFPFIGLLPIETIQVTFSPIEDKDGFDIHSGAVRAAYRGGNWRFASVTKPIPEPTTIALYAIGILGLKAMRQYRKIYA